MHLYLGLCTCRTRTSIILTKILQLLGSAAHAIAPFLFLIEELLYWLGFSIFKKDVNRRTPEDKFGIKSFDDLCKVISDKLL